MMTTTHNREKKAFPNTDRKYANNAMKSIHSWEDLHLMKALYNKSVIFEDFERL